jgi:hypothetical protein
MVFPFSVSGGYLIVLIEVVWWIVNAVDRVVYGKQMLLPAEKKNRCGEVVIFYAYY